MPDRLDRWLVRTEVPMLVLALVAVAAYLGDLLGAWTAMGVGGGYRVAAVVVDLVFVVDLAAKLIFGGVSYVRTPWFLVDLVCTLPIFASLSVAPTALQSLRFVRAF